MAQSKRVLLIGELPLLDELAHLCAAAGHAVSMYLVEDLVDAGALDRIRRDGERVDAAIDVISESIDTKRSVVAMLDAALPPAALLIASVLSTTVTLAGSW